jgi:imidazoleglycerol phosphate synthase glutamine amidotransferase subunit HisH
MPKVHLLDYVAGNIRSLVNAIEKCGYEVEWIRSPEDVKTADVSVLLQETFARMVNYFAKGGNDSES